MIKLPVLAPLALSPLIFAPLAEAAGLAPHRAVYDLSLSEANAGAGIVGADGRLVIELDDACDSWAASERMVLRMTSAEGAVSLLDYRFSSLEAKDSGAYRFTASTFAGGQEVERRAGRLQSAEDGARIVKFDAPTSREIELPAEAGFPSQQLSELLAAADGGLASHEGLLFDGVSETDVSYASAAIRPLGAEPAAPEGLEGQERWRVSAAYFNPAAPDGRPEYEVTFDLYETGVAARMTMVYEDFALSAHLTEITIRAACEG